MTSITPYSQPTALTASSPPTPPAPEAEGLDFASLFEAARRRYVIFLAVFVVVLGLAIALTAHQKKAYTASSTVMVDPKQLQLFQGPRAAGVSSDLSLSTEAVATQVELIQSRGTAEHVVDQLRLDQDPRFNTTAPGLRGQLMAKLARLMGGAEPAPLTPEQKRQAIINLVQSRVNAARVGLTYVIGIAYTDAYPDRAAAIANAYADVYVAASLQNKSDATRQAGGYLNSRLDQLGRQAAADAVAVQQYKVEHNLLGAANSTLTEQEISNLNGQIAAARAEAAADQARVNTARAQLSKGSTGEDVGAALTSPVVQSLRSQRAQVSGQLAELNSRYGPRYPDIVKAQQQLADIDAQIKAEIHRVISNLQATAQVSAGRLSSLEGTLNQSRGTLATDTRSQAGLIELQQKAQASQTLYDDYLSRFKEVAASAGTEQSDSRIVSQAQVPMAPSSPRVVLDIALGVIIAGVLGTIAAVIAELMDRSFSSGVEIERRLHTHYMGSIPMLTSVARGARRTPTEYVVANPFSVFSEAFRNMKVSILQAKGGGGPAIVAVTSPLSGEGKTTTAVCLGETSSLQGSRTIVVDCDLRRRTLQRFLEHAPSAGLVEVVQGQAKLDDVIVIDEKSHLHFLPLAQGKLTVDDIFGVHGMDELLQELRRRYDFIILDTAPLLALADARLLAAKCDAVVLLCRWRKTPQDAVKSALRLLQTAGAPVSGVALTRVDVRKQAAHGYGDSTYYYRETAEYYAA